MQFSWTGKSWFIPGIEVRCKCLVMGGGETRPGWQWDVTIGALVEVRRDVDGGDIHISTCMGMRWNPRFVWVILFCTEETWGHVSVHWHWRHGKCQSCLMWCDKFRAGPQNPESQRHLPPPAIVDNVLTTRPIPKCKHIENIVSLGMMLLKWCNEIWFNSLALGRYYSVISELMSQILHERVLLRWTSDHFHN